jgi:hypothetical protein
MEREEDVLAAIREGLALLGFVVLSTTVRRVRHGYGASPGVPDLLISRDTWPSGCFLGIEVKGTKTRLSAAQQRLQAAGRLYICRSWEDALAAVRAFEERFRT